MTLKKIGDKFKKKGLKGGLFKEANSRVVSEDYNAASRMPYLTDLGGVSPLDYKILDGIGNLPRVVAQMADEPLSNVEFDQFNDGSFLDEYIDLYVGLARNDLERQRIHHGHVIDGLKMIEESRMIHDAQMQKLLEKELEGYQDGKEEKYEEA